VTTKARTVDELFGADAIGAHNRALSGDTVTFEAELDRRHYFCRLSPAFDPSGSIIGVVGSAVDRTEMRKSEKAVASSESWFRSLIEGSYDLVAAVDYDGYLIYTSPAAQQVLDYTPESLASRAVLDLVHEEDRLLFEDRLRRTIATNEPSVATVRFATRNNASRHLEVRFRPGCTPDGTPTIVLNCLDVTERLRLQREFDSAERLASLGRVASSIAHEFNNVLMGIQPHAELVLRKAPAAEAHAKSILGSVDRGRRVTQDVLRFTRARTPEVVPLDVAAFLEKLRPELASLLREDIALVIECEPRLTLLADGEQLAQAITNLATNARDAMPRGGVLAVRARRRVPEGSVRDPHRYADIAVHDTGLGISEEVKARMFEPLFTTKRGSGGTGLGLNVVYQIARAHGGTVSVESEIGSGATFHLLIPKSTAVVEERQPEPKPASLREVMIVEDDPAVATALIELATTLGLQVVHYSTAAAAIERFDENHPEVALLDIGLPDIDGTQLALMLWRLQPELPIVFMTGHSEKQLLPTAVAHRATLLRKPFDATTLMNALSHAVELNRV
jgi:PAS domain S-box-containing protein